MNFLHGRSLHQAEINGQTITVEPDETLLEAAQRQNINIPSICRVGGCGTCKCKLKSGKVDELTETAYLLTEKEISDGFILACQSRLRSDVKIELDREGAIDGPPVKGVIVGKQMLTHDIARIDLRLDTPIRYRAGQFAEVTLSSMADAPRSYSFSTAPGNDRQVSFTVRRVPGGGCPGISWTRRRWASRSPCAVPAVTSTCARAGSQSLWWPVAAAWHPSSRCFKT